MAFGTDIHVPHMLNSKFGNPLTFLSCTHFCISTHKHMLPGQTKIKSSIGLFPFVGEPIESIKL